MIYYVTYLLNGSFQMDICWDLNERKQSLSDVYWYAASGYDVSNLTVKSYKLYR